MASAELERVVQGRRRVAVSSLTLWERNPRTISADAFGRLMRSMEEAPEMMEARPLIALPDGRVIAGNMRLRAAIELGWAKVPVVYVDLDEDRATTWALRDNNAYGEWNEQELAELLYELEQRKVDLDLTGLSRDATKALLDSVRGPELPDVRGTDLALADVSIGAPEHTVERGQVWALGHHVLVIAGVYDGWGTWAPLLEAGEPDDDGADRDTLFVPYPTPTLTMTERAKRSRLVLVQPDVWMAGHVLDKWASATGGTPELLT